MKLGKDVLLEIVAIVQEGLVEATDVSQALRDLDLTAWPEGDICAYSAGELTLSESYVVARGRGK